MEKWFAASSSQVNGMNGVAYDEIVAKAALKEALMGEMALLAKENDLKPFEQVKDILVTPEVWSVENDLLTPTFKVKRNALKKAFQPQIDNMYSKLW